MFKRLVIRPNSYYDSIALMRLTQTVRNIDKMVAAQVGMATELNKDAVREMGFVGEELKAATANDLIVALVAETEDALDKGEQVIKENLERPTRQEPGTKEPKAYATLSEAAAMDGAGIAAISVPGEYAARETRAALANGLHVFLFSDNVSLEDEVALKKLGQENGLFVMGPDCGTAVVGGLGLGFANKVRPGKIGIVAASGTGMQQVMTIIDMLGEGISEAIGTGGRDLSMEVGGITSKMGLAVLERDPNTAVKVLISKPPHPDVRESLTKMLDEGTKPAVVCFMGEDIKEADKRRSGKVLYAGDLEEAAILAYQSAGGDSKGRLYPDDELSEMVKAIVARGDSRGYFRGLYGGGTLCQETMTLLSRMGIDVYSNIAWDRRLLLEDPEESRGNACIDMGDDYFTQGKPHPMLEPGMRVPRYLAEAGRKDVGILLFDVILGYGCHSDPAGIMAEAVKEARKIRKDMGQGLVQIAVIVGTMRDPQGLEEQEAILRDAGAIVLSSNRAAGNLVAGLIKAEGGKKPCLR